MRPSSPLCLVPCVCACAASSSDDPIATGTSTAEGADAPASDGAITGAADDAVGTVASTSSATTAVADDTGDDSGPPPTDTELAKLAATLQPGQWAQLESAAGRELFQSAEGEGAGGIRNPYATKFAFDPATRRFLFIDGDHDAQDHFFVYDEFDDAWTEGPPLPWTVAEGAAIHGYEHNVFVPELGAFFFRKHRGMELMRWNGGSDWSEIPLSPGLGYASAASGIAWFPELGRIVVFQNENGSNGALLGIDPATGAQTTLVSAYDDPPLLAGSGDYHNFAHYDPVAELVWFGGGNEVRTSWTIDADGVVTPMPPIPEATGGIGPGNRMSLPVDNPNNGGFLVFQDRTTYYDFDPGGGGSWTAHTDADNEIWATDVHDPTETAYGTQACPRADLGVIVFIKGVSRSQPAQMWLYRPLGD